MQGMNRYIAVDIEENGMDDNGDGNKSYCSYIPMNVSVRLALVEALVPNFHGPGQVRR
jgi:hypothetical protein